MDYSGRCMFGKYCYEMRSPAIDQMGLGLIAYWPSISTEELPAT
jgi:hypothetical protein